MEYNNLSRTRCPRLSVSMVFVCFTSHSFTVYQSFEITLVEKSTLLQNGCNEKAESFLDESCSI